METEALRYVATIGFFDGVHCGHRWLIRQLTAEARQRGMRSMLVTFDRHPREVLAAGQEVPPLLSTQEEKLQLLRASGADEVRVLHFTLELAALTAREFMERVLRNELGVRVLVIGYDHHFGRPLPTADGHREGFADYEAYGREVGIEVVRASAFEAGEGMPQHVSSSAVRRALEAGDVASASAMLGRPYAWTGRVVHGHEAGRRLGFPTANLEGTDEGKMLPKGGAYAVMCHVEDAHHGVPGMLNIGKRPTMDNGEDMSIEVHLFDFHNNLYGKSMTLEFVDRLRDERRFCSEEELRQQLETDAATSRSILRARQQQRWLRREERLQTMKQEKTMKQRHWWTYILIFLVSQLTAAGTAFVPRLLRWHWSAEELLVGTLLIANVLAIALFFCFRPDGVSWQQTKRGLHGEGLRRTGLCLALALPTILLTNLVQEVVFPELPNLIDNEMMQMFLDNPVGLLTVCLLGPLSEELLFRGGVQKSLKHHAILWSALLFALVHLNPAQMPTAFIMGCLLGFAHGWTGSLAAPVIIHVFNNSLACFCIWLSPADESIIALMGGYTPAVIAAIVSLVLLVGILYCIWKKSSPAEKP